MALPSLLPTLLGYGLGFTAPSEAEPWDVLLGGYRFMLAASPENPFIRRGAQYRSDQVNFSGEPGETALGFWWQRSQSTWHLGTGSPTFDGPGSGSPDIASARYADSYGIDPWTSGEISLLHDTQLLQVTLGSAPQGPVTAFNAAGSGFVYWSDEERFFQYSDGGGTIVATGAWATITSMTSNGTSVYISDDAQIIGFTPSGTFQYYTGLTGDRFCLRWAKQRLMFAQDASIYELSIAGPTGPLPAPAFTHPNPNWVWTDIAQGPGAIYASGHAGSTSAVYKFVLTTDGALPTLSAGITACELPDGEQALCLQSYLQLFIAIGTSQGLRVCSFSDTDIALAPLTIEGVGAVRDVVGWDRFLYATCDDAGQGCAGLARVDLSAEVATSRYAWAPDARANGDPAAFAPVTGAVTGVAMYVEPTGETPVFLVGGSGLYGVHFTRLGLSGFLTSGRIYFGMSDLKIFQRMSITTGGQGIVSFFTGTDSDTADISRATIDTGVRDRIEVDIGSTRGSTLTVGLGLTRSSITVGPKVLAWAAKALPSQPREEQFLVPLRCYDHMENGFGETSYASAIEISDGIADLVRTQEPTAFQTFFGDNVSDWRTWIVQIEDHEFRQSTSEGGWGGLLTVSLRTVIGE